MAPAPTQPLRCVVVGSGNGAQTAAAHLGARGHEVHMLFGPKYAARAAELAAAITANGGAITLKHPAPAEASEAPAGAPVPRDGLVTRGAVAGVTSDAAAVIPGADIIVISMNGPAMAAAAEQIAPYLRPQQLVLYLMGVGGVNNLQLAAAAARHGLPPPIYAATKTLPWACRVQAPGAVSVMGTKLEVPFTVAPDAPPLVKAALPALLSELFAPVRFNLAASPLDDTLLPYETIVVVHPGVMYARWAGWDGAPLAEKPLFYHSVTEEGAAVVEALEAEAMAVANALRVHAQAATGRAAPEVLTLKDRLGMWYGSQISDYSSLHSALTTNAGYAGIYHPMREAPDSAGWLPDFSSRLLTEDVPFALVPLRGAAEALGLATPAIDKVLAWAQGVMGKEYLVDGRLCGKDLAETAAPQAHGPAACARDLFFANSPVRAKARAVAMPSPFAAVAAASPAPSAPATPPPNSGLAPAGARRATAAVARATSGSDYAQWAEEPDFGLVIKKSSFRARAVHLAPAAGDLSRAVSEAVALLAAAQRRSGSLSCAAEVAAAMALAMGGPAASGSFTAAHHFRAPVM